MHDHDDLTQQNHNHSDKSLGELLDEIDAVAQQLPPRHRILGLNADGDTVFSVIVSLQFMDCFQVAAQFAHQAGFTDYDHTSWSKGPVDSLTITRVSQ